MEKVTVNIEDIADAMEATMDGWEQYLNMETGEIVSYQMEPGAIGMKRMRL